MSKKVVKLLLTTISIISPLLASDAFPEHTDTYHEEGTFDQFGSPIGSPSSEQSLSPADQQEHSLNKGGQFDTFYHRFGTFDSIVKESLNEQESSSKSEHDGLESMINKYVDFGGVIEVEAYTERDYNCHRHSNVVLEAVELDFEITLNECARGFASIEYDGDFDDIIIKEAFALLGDTDNFPYFAQIGRVYVPFGIGTGALVGDTLSIEDPLTIEIFETREDVILVGARSNGFYGGLYVFNGDTLRNKRHDHIDQYGGTIRYAHENCRYSFNAGFDMISTVFDSEEIAEEIPEAFYVGGYPKGLAAHFRVFSRGFSLIGEFNGTFRGRTVYVKEEGQLKKVRLKPKAWQIEIGYQRELYCRTTYVAANFSQSRGMYGYFPRSRFLATVGRWIYEGVLLALEYGHDVDYSLKNGGTGLSADFFIMQLAFEW